MQNIFCCTMIMAGNPTHNPYIESWNSDIYGPGSSQSVFQNAE
jgi:hypothetical protein